MPARRHQEWEIAPLGQAVTQGRGGLLEGGLQGLHSYFNFFVLSLTTTATGSSRSGSFGSSSTFANTCAGQAGTQVPQPSHLSVSRVIKKSPDASLYP